MPQRTRAKEPPDRPMKDQTLKVTLPGDLYEQAGQWWWRTRLPGESRAKARPLDAPAACDRGAAEKVAVGTWEQAVRKHEAKRIALDCTEKVERLKAQFLDKVRQLTEIVESANVRAQAEAQARAGIEARLNAMIQAAGQTPATPSAQTQNAASSPIVMEDHDLQPQTGTCECCGAAEIAVSDLATIDSGQWLCPDCIAALQIDISRIEARAFSDSRG
jgi:hypothetical protein